MVQYMDNNANSGFAAWAAAQQKNKPQSRFGKFLWWTFLFLVAWWIVGLFMDPAPKSNVQTVAEPTVTVDVSNVPSYEIASNEITAKSQGLRISNIDLKKLCAFIT